MKFNEYLSQKEKLQESKLNEDRPTDATNVDFGLFSFGGGGELDTAAATVAVAALVVMKGIYNGVIYSKLKARLPEYIKMHKLTQAPQSKTVFEHKWNDEHVEPLKKQLSSDVAGKSTEELIKDQYRKAIDNQQKGEMKDALRKKRDMAIERVRIKEENLKNKIELAESQKDVEWARMEEAWRVFELKFQKIEESFVTVDVPLLASSWKKRWESEFAIAKAQANIEILDEAGRLAAEKKLTDALDEIKNSKKIQEKRIAKAEAAIAATDQDAVGRAEIQQATASEFGIVQFMQTNTEYNQTAIEKKNKWTSLGEKKPNESENFSWVLEKITNIKRLITDSNKQKKYLLPWLEECEKEITSKGISLNYTAAHSMMSMINEKAYQYDLLDEKKKTSQPSVPSFTSIISAMAGAIKSAPEKDVKSLVISAIADIEELKNTKESEINARNKMAELIDNNADQEKDQRKLFPKGFEVFKKLKPIEDAASVLSIYDKSIEKMKEYIKEEPKNK